MRGCLNAPFDDMNLNIGSFVYGLAHLALDNPEYVSYLGQSERYTILDNGADEGDPAGGEDLWGLVEKIRPDELILPDVLKDKDATYEASMEFYNEFVLGSRSPVKLMAVAQGSTYDEWMESYRTWQDLDFIDVVGVPYDIDFHVGSKLQPQDLTQTESRSYMRRELVNELYYSNYKKPIHLLGLNNLTELSLLRDSGANRSGFIRSHDTTAPFAAAVQGIDWTKTGWDFEKNWPALDFNHKWGTEDKIRAYNNLMAYAEATGDHGVSYNLGRVVAAGVDPILQESV